jgi:hypothetical protein
MQCVGLCALSLVSASLLLPRCQPDGDAHAGEPCREAVMASAALLAEGVSDATPKVLGTRRSGCESWTSLVSCVSRIHSAAITVG